MSSLRGMTLNDSNPTCNQHFQQFDSLFPQEVSGFVVFIETDPMVFFHLEASTHLASPLQHILHHVLQFCSWYFGSFFQVCATLQQILGLDENVFWGRVKMKILGLSENAKMQVFLAFPLAHILSLWPMKSLLKPALFTTSVLKWDALKTEIGIRRQRGVHLHVDENWW